MRVEDLLDCPALRRGSSEALLIVERIDRERVARLGTGDQVVEIAVRVAGPDLFDDHCPAPHVIERRSNAMQDIDLNDFLNGIPSTC